jgi:hypothetical protein
MQELEFFAFALFWYVEFTGYQVGGAQALKRHYIASCLIPGGAHRCKENHVHYRRI